MVSGYIHFFVIVPQIVLFCFAGCYFLANLFGYCCFMADLWCIVINQNLRQ